MKKMSVNVLAHQLTYAPRGGTEAHDATFQPLEILKVSTTAEYQGIHPLVYQLLEEGTLVVKSSSSNKCIYSGVQYVIAKPTQEGLAVEDYYLDNVDNVRKLLASGWRIARYSSSMRVYLDVLVPSDMEYLGEHYDLAMRWNEAVAAVINCDIELNCNWSSGGYFTRALAGCLKNTEIVVPADATVFETGDRVSAAEFFSAYVTRSLEGQLNAVFDLVKRDPNAIYVAEATNAGVNVARYADVRAVLWQVRDDNERLAREQKIEDGLG
jgi:hypothetical protein